MRLLCKYSNIRAVRVVWGVCAAADADDKAEVEAEAEAEEVEAEAEAEVEAEAEAEEVEAVCVVWAVCAPVLALLAPAIVYVCVYYSHVCICVYMCIYVCMCVYVCICVYRYKWHTCSAALVPLQGVRVSYV
jgi:hypothetical protein